MSPRQKDEELEEIIQKEVEKRVKEQKEQLKKEIREELKTENKEKSSASSSENIDRRQFLKGLGALGVGALAASSPVASKMKITSDSIERDGQSIWQGGLFNADNYLTLDGSNAMAGDLDLGGNSLINVTNIDGVDISSHVNDTNNPHGVTASQIGALAETDYNPETDTHSRYTDSEAEAAAPVQSVNNQTGEVSVEVNVPGQTESTGFSAGEYKSQYDQSGDNVSTTGSATSTVSGSGDIPINAVKVDWQNNADFTQMGADELRVYLNGSLEHSSTNPSGGEVNLPLSAFSEVYIELDWHTTSTDANGGGARVNVSISPHVPYFPKHGHSI